MVQLHRRDADEDEDEDDLGSWNQVQSRVQKPPKAVRHCAREGRTTHLS